MDKKAKKTYKIWMMLLLILLAFGIFFFIWGIHMDKNNYTVEIGTTLDEYFKYQNFYTINN